MTGKDRRHARIPVAGLAALTAGLGIAAALAAAPGSGAAAIPGPATIPGPAAIPGPPAGAAAATWTIKPGGSVMAASGKATFKDPRTGSVFTCTSVHMTGTLKSGTGLSGSGAGSISAVTFTNCTSPLNVVLPLTAAALPWHVNLAADNNGVVTGTISHMRITEKGPGCAFVLDGTGATAGNGHVRFRYANGTGRLQVLTAGSGLHYYAVMGCAGLFETGDADTISDTFTLTPGQVITSP